MVSSGGRPRAKAQAFLEAAPVRTRRPYSNNAVPVRETRPVVEEVEEEPEVQQEIANFDDEVAKLGISSLQSSIRQAQQTIEDDEEDEEPQPAPKPVQFRPERPLPILRQDVREQQRPVARPAPVLQNKPLSIKSVKTAPIPNAKSTIFRENIINSRPSRQDSEEENTPIPIRRPLQQQVIFN